MFILYAILIGVLIGALAGGRLEGLARLEFRWGPLILAGLLVQVILFADPVAERIGALGPPIYVASTAAVLAGVLRNYRIVGMAVVALGAVCNMAAILANGGFMPVSAEALAAQGRSTATIYSNSRYLESPNLAPLTDIFAMPHWLPFANVFSVGDLLIGIGIALAIVWAMRGARDAARDAE